ncbi:MAG: 16S rRNA (guanine(527)-N(7))-methyltransferase RsmG [Bryobacteraceae bacterium]
MDRKVILIDEQISALDRHYQLLVKWNRVLNLTSIRNTEEAVIRHYCECLFFASLLPDSGRVLDLGSGAGFPGVPVAILHPEMRVTLLESHQRKAVFLKEATRDLKNVDVVPKRAEDTSGTWDLVVSRAVDPQEVLRQAPRLASRIGMLVGGADSLLFEKRTKLPWGDDRWAAFTMFHVEH